METRPTTRNPYLETLDEGVYPNTTAKTTMDKEATPIKKRGLWPIGRITGNKPTDDDQIRVYFVKIRDKIASIPAIRLAPSSPDYCNQPANEDSRQ